MKRMAASAVLGDHALHFVEPLERELEGLDL
jgi:hypothetical protein